MILTNEKAAELNQVFVMEVNDKIKGNQKECRRVCKVIL
jgi:hypothetical protein